MQGKGFELQITGMTRINRGEIPPNQSTISYLLFFTYS